MCVVRRLFSFHSIRSSFLDAKQVALVGNKQRAVSHERRCVDGCVHQGFAKWLVAGANINRKFGRP